MRKRSQRQEAERFERSNRVVVAISHHRGEFVGIVMATVATFAIFINALFLQNGPHPAPIFAASPAVKIDVPVPRAMPKPQPQLQPQLLALPATTAPETTAPSRPQLIADIQRELQRRGFYDGALDGIWGARTDAATRDFLQAANTKMNPDASEALLRLIAGSSVKAPRPSAPVRNDPIAELIAPSKRILAIQRALADFGYGQIKPTGVYDPETRAAIEKFERDRRLPVTGQINDTFVRDLAAMTGRPLE
ncbi:MAG: peptidoglycan-binding domain-containing protein [Pseudolabrys sp.]|nr:peptidoglycan-binding domain-containing protein [Pseudolabrys sp.]